MPEPGAPITFASFNNFLKVTNEVLETWALILAQVPGSRLLLKSPYFEDSETRASVMERITAAGLPETRVELLGFLPSTEEHLATYSRVDVALDTFPYNGTTTTCEALWMGVPVVSIAGDRHASRVGLSILSAIGHQEWAPPDRDTHIQTAVNLATNESLRRELRTSLRQKMAASLLLDHATQSRNFESALRQAWQEWCSELKPAPLPQ
jgi:predicted O-linked N-acetylglucosamine transferase (SPINDLY family)